MGKKNKKTSKLIQELDNLKKELPDASISALTWSYSMAVFENNPAIDLLFDLAKKPSPKDINKLQLEGLVKAGAFDNIEKNEYPMPINVSGSDDVYVGRIRRDFSEEKSLNMWVAADNLRKGAATNTVQIAEYMINNKLI